MMAARGENLGQVAVTMLFFGVGAALPLLVLGMVSRETITRMRGRLVATGHGAKVALDGVLITIGLLFFLVSTSPLRQVSSTHRRTG